jgi:gas vesicle protein
VKLESRQRSVLIVGALIGAVLGAGTAWLLTQSVGEDARRPKTPLRPGDLFKLTSHAAGLLREIDELRRRA